MQVLSISVFRGYDSTIGVDCSGTYRIIQMSNIKCCVYCDKQNLCSRELKEI